MKTQYTNNRRKTSRPERQDVLNRLPLAERRRYEAIIKLITADPLLKL